MIINFLDYLKEIEFNMIPTDYIINYTTLKNKKVESYDFDSKSGIGYSVYFLITNEDDELLSNNHYLNEYGDITNIPTIFFSLTNRGFGENFDDLTNNNEKLEVMGKIVYLINDYINKHDYDIYSIGEVDEKKMKFYNYYRKYFKEYQTLTDKSKYYTDIEGNKTNAYYLVKSKNTNINKIKLSENCFLNIK